MLRNADQNTFNSIEVNNFRGVKSALSTSRSRRNFREVLARNILFQKYKENSYENQL